MQPVTTSEREPLDRERVLATAVAYADANGLAALSMRKLARELGFEVMSLYNHVANKADLVDAMVDRVASEIEPADPSLAWRPSIRATAMSAHDALLRHPWATTVWSTSWPGPNRWRQMEAMLEVLAGAGFPDEVADLAFHAVTLHIAGFTRQQVTYREQSADGTDEERLAKVMTDAPETDFPRVHEHIRYHQHRDAGRDTPLDEFGFVLDLILDGLEQAGR